MMLKIKSVNLSYKDKKLDEAELSYKADDDDNSARGIMTLNEGEYEGNEAVEKLETLARDHFISSVEKSDFEIRSINMKYEESTVKKVDVVYQARLKDREFRLTGSHEISSEEYNENKPINDLAELCKAHLKEKFESED